MKKISIFNTIYEWKKNDIVWRLLQGGPPKIEHFFETPPNNQNKSSKAQI